FLDEVHVDMQTCEELRTPSPTSQLPNYVPNGKYGFSEKVVDGIFLCVNSVIVNFTSPAFHACLQLSRVQVRSVSPQWQTADLRMTRVRDATRGEVLTFKEMDWQTLRIEATSVAAGDATTTPLRLITNQARCRITIKKRLTGSNERLV
ncbi:PREDICTED: UHRF1-binding protein 1-like, partial [Priapulus caudatus]|uniref:UHRF1-binding protein 1-like n=1 Tax=Priapulus caudatus TaxID=37621 RepID=A0ABM1EP88_PRICU